MQHAQDSTPLRCVLEVRAGIQQGIPIHNYTRTWSVEYNPQALHDFEQNYHAARGNALRYAIKLQNPQRCSWVTMEWQWE